MGKTLKDKVNDNIVWVILVTSGASCLTLFGILQSIHKHEIESIRDDYHQKLSQITFTVSTETPLNVDELLISKGEALTNRTDMDYFEEGFYAPKTAPEWRHGKTDAWEFMSFYTNHTVNDFEWFMWDRYVTLDLAGGLYLPLEDQFHAWRSNEPLKLVCKGRPASVYPHISIQKLVKSDTSFLDFIASYMIDNKESLLGWGDVPDSNLDTMLDEVSSRVRQNMHDWIFFSQLRGQMLIMGVLGIDMHIVQMQRGSNGFYAQSIHKINHCDCEQSNRNPYSLDELITVEVDDAIFIINMKIPSSSPNPDPRVLGAIHEFVSNLRFVD